jgi:hypothetical protein
MRRFGLAAVLVALVAGCGGSDSAKVSERDFGISFSRPSAWKYERIDDYSIRALPIAAAVSTQPLRSPCRYRGNGMSCSPAFLLERLQRGGALAVWFMDSAPAPPGGFQVPKGAVRVGGLYATITDHHGAGPTGECTPGSDAAVTAVVGDGKHQMPLFLVACTDGGDFKRFKTRVLAMIRSASFRT